MYNDIGYQSQYKEPRFGDKMKGYFWGAIAASATEGAGYVGKLATDRAINSLSEISADEFFSIADAVDKACKEKKIVNNIEFPTENCLLAFKNLGHKLNTKNKLSKTLDSIFRFKGASFLPVAVPLLAIPAAFVAFFDTKKAPDEQPVSKFDEVKTFIRDNAGVLTFASLLPCLLESGVAAIKGGKFAKKLLSPELAKRVAKTNALSFVGELISSAGLACAVSVARDVKDTFAQRKSIYDEQYEDGYYQDGYYQDEQGYYDEPYYDDPYYNDSYYENPYEEDEAFVNSQYYQKHAKNK